MRQLWLPATVLVVTLLSTPVFAESQAPVTAETKPWAHESELGITTVGGNTKTESYNLKQKTSYTFDLNKFTLAARYLKTKSGGVESARNWDGSIRYDREISARFSIFASNGLESDVFAGYVQRTNYDLGATYAIVKSEPTNWIAEAGYRYTDTQFTVRPVGTADVSHLLRIFSEVNQTLGKQASARFWVEYLPNLSEEDEYRVNLEPSIVAQLTGIFSLKTGYLIKYQNRITAPVTERTDSFFTTSLVAKF